MKISSDGNFEQLDINFTPKEPIIREKKTENVFLTMRSLAFISFYLIILPIISKEYNILKFGAIGDGRTLNTSCIQKATDSAHMQGGGQVIIPTGKFLTGSIILKSNVDLHLEKRWSIIG